MGRKHIGVLKGPWCKAILTGTHTRWFARVKKVGTIIGQAPGQGACGCGVGLALARAIREALWH